MGVRDSGNALLSRKVSHYSSSRRFQEVCGVLFILIWKKYYLSFLECGAALLEQQSSISRRAKEDLWTNQLAYLNYFLNFFQCNWKQIQQHEGNLHPNDRILQQWLQRGKHKTVNIVPVYFNCIRRGNCYVTQRSENFDRSCHNKVTWTMRRWLVCLVIFCTLCQL